MQVNNLRYCIECGKERVRSEKYCKQCGTKYPKTSYSLFKTLLYGSLGILILITITALLSNESTDTSLSNNLESVPGQNPHIKTQNANQDNKNIPDVTETVVNVYCPLSGNEMSFSSEASGGSGTVITDSGVILTNSHVIPQDGDFIDTNEEGCFVIFPDKKSGSPKEIYLAKPYVFDETSDNYDLAFLEIYDAFTDSSNTVYGTYPSTFKSLTDESCNGDNLKLGEKIYIYGYPSSTGGVSLTVTEGIVSAFSEEGIFTSAKIDEGNSGGLATDAFGCFIGVPTAVSKGKYESYGLIIPASTVWEFGDEVEKLFNSSGGN